MNMDEDFTRRHARMMREPSKSMVRITKDSNARAIKAAQLRAAGKTWKEIGALVGVNGPVTATTAMQLGRKGQRLLARRSQRATCECGGGK